MTPELAVKIQTIEARQRITQERLQSVRLEKTRLLREESSLENMLKSLGTELASVLDRRATA